MLGIGDQLEDKQYDLYSAGKMRWTILFLSTLLRFLETSLADKMGRWNICQKEVVLDREVKQSIPPFHSISRGAYNLNTDRCKDDELPICQHR